jgi:hypothetical protein
MAVLDSNIAALMNQTVTWEKWNGTSTLYADPNYAAPKSLTCFIEEKGYSGGAKMYRRPDDSVADAFVDLYFDANDADVMSFSLKDRFTLPSALESSETLRTQPETINTFVGPQGERWIVVVTL